MKKYVKANVKNLGIRYFKVECIKEEDLSYALNIQELFTYDELYVKRYTLECVNSEDGKKLNVELYISRNTIDLSAITFNNISDVKSYCDKEFKSKSDTLIKFRDEYKALLKKYNVRITQYESGGDNFAEIKDCDYPSLLLDDYE